MAEMTGGQALVAQMQREGVEVVFGLPGVQLDGAFDALYHVQDQVRIYWTRHEQAAGYMADGYARALGRPGICLVVPGPGLLNAGAALSTAYACNSPVVCIAGQIPSDMIDAGRGLLHEIPNQLGLAASVSKWAGRAVTPAEVPGVVQEAFRQARSDRPRPVVVEIPQDTLLARGEVTLLPPSIALHPGPDPDSIREAARLLGAAERPAIFSGGGVLAAGAWDELREVAELLEAPVVESRNGRGSISSRHELALLPVAQAPILAEADVILAVGTRFLDPTTLPWGIRDGQTWIHMNVDPEDIGRIKQPTIGIHSDARLGLRALADALPAHNRTRPSRRQELRALKARAQELVLSIPQGQYGMAIREALPDEGVLVLDITQIGHWAPQGYPVYAPRTLIGAGYQGTLGCGYGLALGVKVARPDVPVVAACGDGGFMYQVQELATAAQHGIGVVCVVFNDGAYGNVMRIQQERYGNRVIASKLQNPDFVKLAELFGVEGRRAEGPDGLRAALAEAIRADRPALVEVPVGLMPNPFGMQLAARALV